MTHRIQDDYWNTESGKQCEMAEKIYFLSVMIIVLGKPSDKGFSLGDLYKIGMSFSNYDGFEKEYLPALEEMVKRGLLEFKDGRYWKKKED